MFVTSTRGQLRVESYCHCWYFFFVYHGHLAWTIGFTASQNTEYKQKAPSVSIYVAHVEHKWAWAQTVILSTLRHLTSTFAFVRIITASKGRQTIKCSKVIIKSCTDDCLQLQSIVVFTDDSLHLLGSAAFLCYSVYMELNWMFGGFRLW